MQFHPSADQRELAASLEDAISDLLPVTRWHHQRWESPAIWDGLTALGLFDMARPETHGGLGLGAVEEILIALHLGRQLASPAIFATLAAVHATPTTETDPLPVGWRFTSGIQQNHGISMAHDPAAKAVIIHTSDSYLIHALPENSNAPIMAGNPWIDDVATLNHKGHAMAHFDPSGLARCRLIWAAALAGLANGAMKLAAEYAKIREQFGRPIGSFQAVKHHCANMLVAARSAGDLVTFAAAAFDEGRPDAPFLAESALITAADAANRNAALNVQIHGGIGFSAEAEPHLYAKRAQLLVALTGGVEPLVEQLSPPQLVDAA